MQNRVVWHYNFLQFAAGLLTAFFIDSAGFSSGVVIYGLAQAVFTHFAFKFTGANNSNKIFKAFLLGELLKITLLFILGYYFYLLLKFDFLYFIAGIIVMQIGGWLAPSICKIWFKA